MAGNDQPRSSALLKLCNNHRPLSSIPACIPKESVYEHQGGFVCAKCHIPLNELYRVFAFHCAFSCVDAEVSLIPKRAVDERAVDERAVGKGIVVTQEGGERVGLSTSWRDTPVFRV
jgi:hypothetical protein